LIAVGGDSDLRPRAVATARRDGGLAAAANLCAQAAAVGPLNAAGILAEVEALRDGLRAAHDAVELMLADPPDLMIVVGGYNSSNTTHLAKLSASRGVTTYHVEDSDCLDPEIGTIRHRPVGRKGEETATGWLAGVRSIGITAGASTPNNKIGETVELLLRTRGIPLEEPAAAA